MEYYDLEENEVVFYKGQVSQKNKKGTTEVVLTNINLVFVNKYKKLFSKEQITVDTYPINEIKYFNGVPQVVKKGNLIEVYFLGDETEFSFDSRNEARKFINAMLNFLTNKTTFERSAEKVKNTISTIDNTLGIDSKSIAGSVIQNGFVGKTTSVVGKGIKAIGKIIKK